MMKLVMEEMRESLSLLKKEKMKNLKIPAQSLNTGT